jgi:hypothetical protein
LFTICESSSLNLLFGYSGYLNLYDNGFTGTIPQNLALSQLFYFDIGRNQISGTLPSDIGEDFSRLHFLHFDHNRLNGTIPSSFPSAGNGRLYSLLADHNFLSGHVPDDWIIFNKISQYTLHDNNFDSLGENNCQLSIWAGNEMVEFKADCPICTCQDVFCDRMCNDILV